MNSASIVLYSERIVSLVLYVLVRNEQRTSPPIQENIHDITNWVNLNRRVDGKVRVTQAGLSWKKIKAAGEQSSGRKPA